MFLLQITRPLLPVQTNAWDRTLADWIRRGEEATRDYEAVRLNEIDMENGLYRYRVNSVFGSKYALTDDEVVTPQDDLGAQVGNPRSCVYQWFCDPVLAPLTATAFSYTCRRPMRLVH